MRMEAWNMRDKFKQALCEAVARAMPGMESALVFGEGPLGAELMLIGEAPGEREAMLKRPFVGKAGKNLDRFLELAALSREEIYITNAVKIRPTKTGRTGRISNRPPTREEIAWFRPWLLREIAMVRPKMVATLGNVPLRALVGNGATIGKMHGRVTMMQEPPLPLFALYHPASLIYNPALQQVYEEDVRALAMVLRA